jgi:hypothetical protein
VVASYIRIIVYFTLKVQPKPQENGINKKNFLAPTPYSVSTYNNFGGPNFLHVAKDPVAA